MTELSAVVVETHHVLLADIIRSIRYALLEVESESQTPG